MRCSIGLVKEVCREEGPERRVDQGRSSVVAAVGVDTEARLCLAAMIGPCKAPCKCAGGGQVSKKARVARHHDQRHGSSTHTHIH